MKSIHLTGSFIPSKTLCNKQVTKVKNTTKEYDRATCLKCLEGAGFCVEAEIDDLTGELGEIEERMETLRKKGDK